MATILGTENDDSLPGSSDADVITGLDGNDIIQGLGGADDIDGGSGNDNISGGEANDTIVGGIGADSLSGDDGDDSVSAGDDNDTVFGRDGDDTLILGEGNDRADDRAANTDAGNDSIDGGLGADYISDDTGDNTILGGEGNDSIWYSTGSLIDGGIGNDSISYAAFQADGMTITGGQGNDSIHQWTWNGSNGELVIDGGADDDYIIGTSRSAVGDTLIGGEGADLIFASSGNDSLDGGTGNDSLRGDAGNDTLLGGDGVDTLDGSAGNDSLDGGEGDDLLRGNTGDDTIDGGDGNDIAIFAGPQSRYVITQTNGALLVRDPSSGEGTSLLSNIETLRFSDGDVLVSAITPGLDQDGSPDADTLDGTAQTDALDGLAGDDVINGLASTDYITGGDGNDTIDGGTGSDNIDAGADNDSVIGGDGNDTVFGRDGDDTLILGEGNDRADDRAANTDAGNDSIDGGLGADYISDDTGDNTILGGEGNDSIWYSTGSLIDGGIGNDSISYAAFQADGMTITGGQGNDSIHQWTWNGSNGELVIDGGADDDYIIGTSRSAVGDTLIGGEGADLIFASSGNDSLDGGTGNDSLRGDAGNDTILGGDGEDTLDGSAGNDSLDGGLGGDTLTGGTGDDTLDGGDEGNIAVFSRALADYTVTTSETLGEATVTANVGSDGTDIITNIAILRFTDQDMIIGVNPGINETGDGLANTLEGTEGDDTLDGAAGADLIQGFGGADSLVGGADNDTVFGGAGADTLILGEGNDRADDRAANTDAGNDSIDGGLGADYISDDTGDNTILGGEGNDSIWYSTGSLIDGGIGNDSISYAAFQADGMTITGGQGNDSIHQWTWNGSNGELVIDGGADDDYIIGTSRSAVGDTLIGGEGADLIFASSGNDSLDGGTGNDSLRGDAGNDTLLGGDGVDTLDGSAGNDSLDGGEGDDLLRGNTGDDTIDGGDGNDIAIFAGPQSRYVITQTNGALLVRDPSSGEGTSLLSNIETLRFSDGDVLVSAITPGLDQDGSPDADTLDGTAQTDALDGLAGDDVINGLASTDYITGGDGNDTIDGGTGSDNIDAGADNDSVIGGDGNDTVFGRDGDDTLILGDGNDRADDRAANTDAGNDSIDGGLGADYISDDTGDNTILGGEGNDSIWYSTGSLIDGGIGNDSISYAAFQADGMTITGGQGNDSIHQWTWNGSNGELVIDGGADDDYIIGTSRSAVGDTLIGGEGADLIFASSGNDSLDGGTGNDSLRGDAGNDTILGGAGADSLDGSAGNDDLNAGEGDDLLRGSAGNDTLDGGAEDTDIGDVAVYSGTRAQYAVIGDNTGLQVVDNIANRDGTDVIINVETLRFSDGDVAVSSGLVGRNITGTEDDDNGAAGNPGALVGTILNDTIAGLGGDDSIVGLDGQDDIDAGAGNDTIDAGAEDDTIDAGADDDLIIGGAGDDVIAGGTGLNTAVYAGNRADYTITGDEASSTVADDDPLAAGNEGTDTLTNVKILRFADQDFFFNQLPETQGEAYTTNEDSAGGVLDIPFTELLDNDTDGDGDTLTVTGVQNAVNGTVQFFSTFVRFRPDSNFNGDASFEYIVSDGFEEVSQVVQVTVDPVNDAPSVASDTGSTDFETSVTVDVLANDTDIDGDTLIIDRVNDPSNGTATIVDGEILYTPDDGFFGTETFNYVATDGTDERAASVTITVAPPPNTDPVAGDDLAETFENGTTNGEVLGNDSDVDPQNTLTVYAVNGQTAAIGTTITLPSGAELTMQPDGTFAYDPAGAFDLANGAESQDTFEYTVSDGEGGFDIGEVTVTINGVGAGPEATEDAYATDEDTSVSGNVITDDTGNGPDSDPDGDTITVTSVEGRSIGDEPITLVSGATVTMAANGDFTYDPSGALDAIREGGMQVDTFTYDITDGLGGVSSAAAFITVSGVNDAPDAVDDAYGVLTSEQFSGNVITGTPEGGAADADVDGDALSVLEVNGVQASVGAEITLASGALVTLNVDGTFDYDPNGAFDALTYGQTAEDSFEYTVSDGNGGTDTATAAFTIASVQGAPDLVVTQASFEGGRTDQWLSVSYRVENEGGTTPEGAAWKDRLYLSEDQTLDSGDEFLREVNYSGMMDNGDFYSREITVKMPSAPGEYYLIVATDSGNSVLEVDETNNIGVDTAPGVLSPAYSSTLFADRTQAVTGEFIQLTGQATDTETGNGAAYEFVTIEATIGGSTRTANVLTDINGVWGTQFSSLPGQAGTLDFVARHPGNLSEDAGPEASVSVFGMGLSNNFDTFELVYGTTETFTLTLDNFGDLDVTGLEASLEGLPGSWVADIDLSDTLLAGDGSVSVDLTVTVPETTVIDFDDVVLSVTSDQGATASSNLRIDPVVSLADIMIEESSLQGFAIRDSQSLVSFTITNDGLAPSEPITVILPDLDWIGLASPQIIPSLAAGESAEVTLSLMPDETVDFGAYGGSVEVVEAGGDSDFVNFTFYTASDATGTLTLNLVDELFYFSDEMPKVEDGRVTVINAVTGEVFYSNTDVDGMVTIEDIPEGYYNIRIDAADHDSYYQTIQINPGQDNEIDAFMSRQTVKYYWSVTEIEIEDRYEVEIEAEFETDVPTPVVVIDPPLIDLDQLDDVGDTMQVEITATNHGFIAVNDVELNFGSHPFYEFDVPQNVFDLLDAKSAVTFPITITRIADFDDLPGEAAPLSVSDAAGSVPCGISASVCWGYPCGPVDVSKCASIGISNVSGNCGNGGASGFGGFYGGGGFGGFGGFGGTGNGITSNVPTLSTSDFCDDCEDNPIPICLPGAGPFDDIAKIGKGAYTVGNAIKVAGAADSGFSIGSSAASGDGAGAVGGAIKFGAGFIPIVGDLICIADWIKYAACLGAGGGGGGGGGGGSGGPLGAALPLSALLAGEEEGHDHSVEEVVARLELANASVVAQEAYTLMVPFVEAIEDFLVAIFGSDVWIKLTPEDPALQPFLDLMFLYMRDAEADGIADRITSDELVELLANLPQGLTAQDVLDLQDRWNATVAAQELGIADPADLPEGYNLNIVDLDTMVEAYNRMEETGLLADAAAQDEGMTIGDYIVDSINEIVDDLSNEGVCASVRINISQDVVMTRQAFLAELEIVNELDIELENIFLNIEIRDDAGNLVEQNTFGVTDPALAGLTAVDGTGVIAGGSTGTAAYTLIPSRLAAADSAQTYTVSGQFGYTEDGVDVVIPLRSEEIDVRPQAELELDYFLQRNVYSDDPFTDDIVEESQPFALGVLVNNVGAGEANNLTIESAQPKIIENEKGLLIDFEIIGTEVNGEGIAPTLKADFGDVGAGDTENAIWYMESSLQGKFIDYEVSFTHVNSLGIEELSLITETRIHELVHVVKDDREGSDDLTDFLVNDDWESDPFGIPDALYTTEQEILAVAQATGELADGEASDSDLEIVVSATMTAGYSYIALFDPGMGDYTIASITRDSDGKVLDSANYWQTDRTFPANGRPDYEDVLHILDNNELDGEQTYTIVYEPNNLLPIAGADSATTDEDVAVIIDVLDNDSDLDGGTLFISVVGQGEYGTVSLNADGTLTYLPDANYAGLDSFTYVVNDGQGGKATGQVDVTIIDQPDPDSSVRIDVGVGDPDAAEFALGSSSQGDEGDTGSQDVWFAVSRNGDLSGAVTVSLEASGAADSGDYSGAVPSSVTLAAGRSVAYFRIEPTGDYAVESDEDLIVTITGTDRSDVTVEADGDIATHVISNDDVATEVSIAVALDGSGDGPAETSQAEEGGSVTFTVSRSGSSEGAVIVSLAAVGTAMSPDLAAVVPASITLADGQSSASFTIGINDDGDVEADETLAIEITGTDRDDVSVGSANTATHTILNNDIANEAPEGVDDLAQTNVGVAITVDVLTNDSDPEDDPFSLISVSGAVNGTAEVSGNDVVYTPDAGFTGSEVLLYVIEDDNNNASSAELTITVALDGYSYVLGTPEADDLEATSAAQQFELQASDDTVSGTPAELDGDVINDFAAGDQVCIEGYTGDVSVTQTADGAVLSFDGASLTLMGEYSGTTFEVLTEGGKTTVALAGTGATQLSPAGERFISTDNGENRVFGDTGNDVIGTAGGADLISAGGGDDVLLAGSGADILIGGLGTDILTGGAGADIFSFDISDFTGAGTQADFIKDFEIGVDQIELTGFGVTGLGDLDFITVATGDAINLGKGAFIVLEGIDETDLVSQDIVGLDQGRSMSLISSTSLHVLTDASDRFVTTDPGDNEVRAGAGLDAIIGGDGDDTLMGEAGDDVLIGGGGADRLIGGQGADRMTGREGADSFEFTAGEETGLVAEFITDFEAEDTVVLDGFGFNSVDDISFFTAVNGQLVAELTSDHFVVFENLSTEDQLEGTFEFI